jgi:DNA-binding HxlR family transcriptional regulator
MGFLQDLPQDHAPAGRAPPVQEMKRGGTESELVAGQSGAYKAAMEQGYQQFCPVAMAAEILCRRWTMLVLREMAAGSVRFNDLRRGVPRMSPALLSQRLKELEEAGVAERRNGRSGPEYYLTESGRELKPVIMALGQWGHRWVETAPSLERLDVSLLMWDMRRNLDPRPLPERRVVISFRFTDLPKARRDWWLLITPEAGADLCSVDPGFDVDLYVATDLRSMTAIWMGYETVKSAQKAGRMTLTGDRKLAAAMQGWLGLSPFAKEKKLVR